MRWFEKKVDTFLMISTSSIIMQSLRKFVLREPAVGAKIWCLFFCHVLRPTRCLFARVYFEEVLCYSLWVDFDNVFTDFFSEAIALSDALHSSHFRR